jgi:diacylglycerol kinase family enzyme
MAATLLVDGAPMWQAPLTAAIVANARYFGGGMKIAPHADAADGVLDLVVLGALRRLEMLRWLPTIYSGGHLANAQVMTRRASTVVIDALLALPTQVDGEIGGTTPVTITVAPRALRLRLPATG